jgi:hypothetical protein
MSGKEGKLSVEEGTSVTTGTASGVATASTAGSGGKESIGSLGEGLICGSSVAIGLGEGTISLGVGANWFVSVGFTFGGEIKGLSDN